MSGYKKKGTKSEAIRQYLLANPYATRYEVAKAVDCSEALIRHVAQTMRKNDEIPRYYRSHYINDGEEEGKSPAPDFTVESSSALADMITEEIGKDIADATPEEMKKICSAIIRNKSVPYNIRLQAIAQKTKLDYDTVSKHELGPGEPLNKDEATKRLALLIEACGPKMTEDAITMAFGKDKNANNTATMDNGDTPPPNAQAT